MNKLRKEIEFLKRGMQRVRTKLKRLQHDPTLTPSTSTVGLRPKQHGEQTIKIKHTGTVKVFPNPELPNIIQRVILVKMMTDLI